MYVLGSSLTVNVVGDNPEYEEVGLVHHTPYYPAQPFLVVDYDALLGNPICHHPDTQQEHEEEQVLHLVK